MFKLFKSKEEKIQDKQKELEEFTEKYEEYFNSYCFDGKEILVYKEPRIKDNELVLYYRTSTTPEGYFNFLPIWVLDLKYGEGFMKKHRKEFLMIKDQMKKLGLSVTKN